MCDYLIHIYQDQASPNLIAFREECLYYTDFWIAVIEN